LGGLTIDIAVPAIALAPNPQMLARTKRIKSQTDRSICLA
jgi:hypothetical protein